MLVSSLTHTSELIRPVDGLMVLRSKFPIVQYCLDFLFLTFLHEVWFVFFVMNNVCPTLIS